MSNTRSNINFTIIAKIWITFTFQSKIVFVTIFIVGMLRYKMCWIGMNFDKLKILYLVLQVFDKLSYFWLNISFPYDEFLVFLAHHTKFYKVSICVEKINWFEKVFPLLSLFVDVLDKFWCQTKILSCNMASYTRYIMCCIHMRLKGCKNQHTSLNFFLYFTVFNLHRCRPYPICINEKEPIKKL